MPALRTFRLNALSAHSIRSSSPSRTSITRVPRGMGAAADCGGWVLKGRSDVRRTGPRVPRPRMPRSRQSGLLAELRHVLGGRALLALDDLELDALALGERLEATALDGRVVHEAVLLAVLGRDEAKALGVVEPLHGAGR